MTRRGGLIVLVLSAAVTLPSVAGAAPPTVTIEPSSQTVAATAPGSATATFTATATDPDDPGTSPSVSCDPPSGSPFPVGTTTVTCTASDGSEQGSSTATVTVEPFSSPPDRTPPARVTRLQAVLGDRSVELTWQNPRSDFHHVELWRLRLGGASASTGQSSPKLVYSGKGSKFVDRGLKAGVRFRYTLRAVDADGNKSTGVQVEATASVRSLLRPLNGATVAKAPLLTWRPVTQASYYNVQLYLGKRKILTDWPEQARYQVPQEWQFNGSTLRLLPGVYTWVVFPGFGEKTAARYGKQLGESTFAVRPQAA